jgi:type II secretory pathway pseudopilin PulG
MRWQAGRLVQGNAGMRTRSNISGVTIIELVIVIVALGMLSTIMLPRILNRGNDARRAKVDAMQNAVRAAAQVTRAAAMDADQTGATGTVALDGQPVDTRFGYPAASVRGILMAAGIDPGVDPIGTDTSIAGTIQIEVAGAPTAASCRVSYTAPTRADAAPVIDSSATSGC